jgi:hypothetical protein
MSSAKQKRGCPRWFVRLVGELQSVQEVFAVFALLAKIRTTRFTIRHPANSEIREKGSVDIVLVGGGMTIKLKSGAALIRVTDKQISYGVGRNLWDSDHSISIDKFPNLRIEIYKHRGRPKEEFKRAQVRGELFDGTPWPKIAAKIRTTEDSARHYRDRGTTRLNGKVRVETESTVSGSRKASKTSGN